MDPSVLTFRKWYQVQKIFRNQLQIRIQIFLLNPFFLYLEIFKFIQSSENPNLKFGFYLVFVFEPI